MSDFEVTNSAGGFKLKLSRGEQMCLLAFDLADRPTDDFAGFGIEVKAPGQADFVPLMNRLAFDAGAYQATPLNGSRNFSSLDNPFQKFRWLHFPWNPLSGDYAYRVTPMFMPGFAGGDRTLKAGAPITETIGLCDADYDAMDIGFTRNFASSQAYAESFGNNPNIIPSLASQGLSFHKLPPIPDAVTSRPRDVYDWLGFKAKRLIFEFLASAQADPTLKLDVFAYDFNEPDILGMLLPLGNRLRIIIDDSKTHAGPTEAETQAAAQLAAAGAAVRRTHFRRLQHNKVLIARDAQGKALKVLCGSTNFSFRGLYIQANNVLVFTAPDVAALFAQAFDIAFVDPSKLIMDPLSHIRNVVSLTNAPAGQFAFSPHRDSSVSLSPVAGAIDGASSSVLFSIAFLNMDKEGPVRLAINRLMERPLFSYGVVDKDSGLQLTKPDGSESIVDFQYLSDHSPEPFKSEWTGGNGIHLHHKFVVTDFNQPTAKVFSGSSNLANGGEQENGDHLIEIDDRKIATVYAIEALRMFDHLHFRSAMKAAGVHPDTGAGKDPNHAMTLALPAPVSGCTPAAFIAERKCRWSNIRRASMA